MNRPGGRDVPAIPQSPADAVDSIDATGGVMTVATRAPSVARDPGTGAHVPPCAPVPARFFAKVEMRGPIPAHRPDLGACWSWTAGVDKDGYGVLRDISRRRWMAHRWSYVNLAAPIPDGLEIDHLCRNRACVNPSHLEPVTHGENLRRREIVLATRCSAGHELTPANTIQRTDRGRRCRTCEKARTSERGRRKRAA